MPLSLQVRGASAPLPIVFQADCVAEVLRKDLWQLWGSNSNSNPDVPSNSNPRLSNISTNNNTHNIAIHV